MKRILLFAVLFFTVVFANAQATFTSSQSGNWDAPTTWTLSNGSDIDGIPDTDDNVNIANSHAITVTANAAATSVTFTGESAVLTMNSGFKLDVTNSVILNSSNTVNTAATISGAGTLNCTSVSVGVSGSPTVNTTTILTSTLGNFNVSGDLVLVSRWNTTINNASFRLEAGILNVDGRITSANQDAAVTSTFTMATGAQTGTLLLSNGTPFNLSTTGTNTINLNGTGTTVNYDGLNNQTVGTYNYNHLTLSGSGAKTTTGVTVNRILSMEGTATASVTPNYGSAATLQYNTATALTASVEWPTTFSGTGGVIIKNTGVITLNNTKTISNGALAIETGAKANLGTFTHTANRLFLGGTIASVGSWGSTTSIATNKNDTYFAATSGLVNVTNSTCTAYQASINSSDSACNTVTPGSVNLKVKLTGGTGPFTVVYRNEITNAIATVTNYVSDSNIVISPLPTQTTPYTLVSVTDAGGCLATLVNAYTSVLFYSIPATPTATTVGVTCPNDTTGSITITNAFFPASLKFNGVNTNQNATTQDPHVDFGAALLSNRAQFTAEGWIKFDKTKYVNRMSLFGQNNVLEFGFESNNLRCWTAGGGTVDMPLTSYPSDNAWHHIAVIGNGTNLRFFIDGVLVATGGGTTTNYGSSTFTTKIGWGVMDAGGVGLVGEVFNLGFWSRALSVEELQGLASGFTRYNSKQVGLLGGYTFDEGGGTTVASVGSPAPVGTLKGATLPVWTDPSVYSWTSAVPGFVTTSNKNLTGLKAGTYNLNISLKGCPKTTSFTVDSTNPGATPPIIGTITQPTCALATGSVALSGLPSSGTWTITATPATADLTGLTGTNVSTTTIGGLTANTSYTFVVSNGTCSSTASAPAVINAVPTTATWNGTAWSGTASSTTPPLITQPVVFTGSYTSSGDINGCSCTVTSGNVLIKDGHTMTITNAVNVTNNATTSLVFENNASLVQTTNATNTGAIEYQRKSAKMKNFDYTYWSSPVANQNIVALSPNTLSDKYFRWDPLTGWVLYNNPTTSVMIPGVGYIIRVPKPGSPSPDNWSGPTYEQPVAFKGVPNNGDVTFNVNADEYNLVGNPYPSALDADLFMTTNTSIIFGALYFWTHNTAIQQSGSNYIYVADDYATYTLTGGVAATTGGLPPSGKIAAGQSFFVGNVSAGSFQFTNAMRNTPKVLAPNSNTQFFKQVSTKKTTTIEKNRVWLNLTNSQGAFKQLLVGYITDATNDWDNLYDGPTFDGQEFVDFYSVNKGQNLTIQGRALPFVDTDVVPLGYRSTIAGAFDISIDNRDGALINQEIWLEDKKTNTLHELSKGKYTFTAINGVENDRFVLKYTNKTLGTNDNELADKALIVSVKNKKITLTSSAEPITQVQIFDLLGRKVYDKSKINVQEWSISTLPSSEQTLIVKTTLANGAITNKKIIY